MTGFFEIFFFAVPVLKIIAYLTLNIKQDAQDFPKTSIPSLGLKMWTWMWIDSLVFLTSQTHPTLNFLFMKINAWYVNYYLQYYYWQSCTIFFAFKKNSYHTIYTYANLFGKIS